MSISLSLMKTLAALLVASVIGETLQTLLSWQLISIAGVVTLYTIAGLMGLVVWALWRGKLLTRRNREFWHLHPNYLGNQFLYEIVDVGLLIMGAVVGTLLGFGLNPLRLL